MSRLRRLGPVNLVLIAVLLAAAIGAYFLIFHKSSTNNASGVRTVAASTNNVTETVTASGSVTSAYSGNVGFDTSGTVSSIDVSVGQSVTKGQKLATLDDAQASLQVEVAQENLTTAQTNLTNAQA
ncbi:MAG: biotin/lipoyl-binding protein, partial [Sciscionella sp.]|nr:biotin/lipoyl-binding protein [Sciscionella sp.]